MPTKKELQKQIQELDSKKEPLQKELNEIYRKEEQGVESKIKMCEAGKGKFELGELVFAAYNRCSCGAGLCYPKNIGAWGAWYCSDILLGRAIPSNQEGGKTHNDGLPFTFYEIKSENQPSANGATTRPTE